MSASTLFDLEQKRFDAWKEFHSKNPIIFQLFCRFAREARDAGRPRFNARAIGERIRWYTAVETTDKEYKINNNHWPYYSRLMAGLDSHFEEFFDFRDERFDATAEEIVAFHSSVFSVEPERR